MPIANLEELCKGVCEIAGFVPPRRGVDELGSFGFRFSGVPVTALEANHGQVALIAEAGPMPEAHTPAGWMALLDANMFMMDIDAARFGRNPFTGEVVVQWMFTLDSVSVLDVYERVMRMVALTLAWRRDPTLASRHSSRAGWESSPIVPRTDGESAVLQSAANFRALHQNVCASIGQAVGVVAQAVTEERFEIRLGRSGLHATVGHLPALRPGFAFIAVHLGTPSQRFALDHAKGVLDANFALLKNPVVTTFCRDPWSGGFLLMYSHALKDIDATPFLERFARVAAIGRAWQRANEVDKENE